MYCTASSSTLRRPLSITLGLLRLAGGLSGELFLALRFRDALALERLEALLLGPDLRLLRLALSTSHGNGFRSARRATVAGSSAFGRALKRSSSACLDLAELAWRSVKLRSFGFFKWSSLGLLRVIFRPARGDLSPDRIRLVSKSTRGGPAPAPKQGVFLGGAGDGTVT